MENICAEDFREKIYLADKRCAVLFTASGCGFCHSMIIMAEKLRPEFDNIRFYLADIEKEPQLKNAMEISAVPTLIVFDDGTPIARATGLLKKSELYAILEAGAMA